MLRWALLGGFGLAIVAGGFYAVQGGGEQAIRIPYGDSAAVARGAAVYEDACASCHGANLEGEANWRSRRPNGRLPAPPHDETGHTWHHPDRQLFEITKYGVAKFAPAGYETDMPGFGETLTDADILASLAYIKSRWPAAIQRRHDAMSADVN